MSVTKGYVTEEDIDHVYVKGIVTELTPILQALTKEVNPVDEFTLESTIYKVLIYINGLVLPKALYSTIVEMSARQLSEYKEGLSSERSEGAVKKVQRGGFSQEFETKQSATAVPRGSQFMQEYKAFLNKFRKMRSI